MSRIETLMNTLASQVQFTAGSVYSSNAYSVAMALGFRFANERVNGVPTDPERFARYESNTESMIENAVNPAISSVGCAVLLIPNLVSPPGSSGSLTYPPS